MPEYAVANVQLQTIQPDPWSLSRINIEALSCASPMSAGHRFAYACYNQAMVLSIPRYSALAVSTQLATFINIELVSKRGTRRGLNNLHNSCKWHSASKLLCRAAQHSEQHKPGCNLLQQWTSYPGHTIHSTQNDSTRQRESL